MNKKNLTSGADIISSNFDLIRGLFFCGGIPNLKKLFTAITIILCLTGIAISSPADDALDLAKSLMDQGDLQGALNAANDGLALEPDNFKLNLLVGEINYQLEDYQNALVGYEKALAKKGKEVDALYGAGMAAMKLRNFQVAEDYFKRALDRKKTAMNYFGVGLAQMELGNYAEADINLRKAIDKNDKDPSYHMILGEINYRNKVYYTTIQEYERAMALDSLIDDEFPRYHYQKAQAYIQLRDLESAISEYKKDLDKHPQDTTAWLELANISQLSGKNSEAAFCLVKFLEIAPNDGERWYSLGVLYLSLRDQEKAAQAFEKAIALNTKMAESYGYLATIYSDRKEYEKAWDAYNRYETTFGPPDSVQYWFDKGKVAIKLGAKNMAYFDTALAAFKKAANMDSTFSSAFEYAGLSEYYKANYAAAVPYFQKKIELDSTSVNSLRNLAFCYLKLGNYPSAAGALERALVLKPEDIQMRSMIGKIYNYDKNYTKAVEHFEILLKDYAADLDDSTRCSIYPDLGSSYLELKKCNTAIQNLLKAENCSPKDISVLFNLAYSYQLCNDMKNSNVYFKKILAIDPRNKDAIKGDLMTTVKELEQ